jgi:hypothetical protein
MILLLAMGNYCKFAPVTGDSPHIGTYRKLLNCEDHNIFCCGGWCVIGIVVLNVHRPSITFEI